MTTICCPRCGETVPTEQAPPSLRCSADASEWARKNLRGPREVFAVVALDTRNRPVRHCRVAMGSLASVVVHPREVFRPLVRHAAAAAILMHSHPSGDVHPSPEDHEVTRRLVEAGRVLGIPVLDHVIVGGNDWFSFRDAGLLDASASAR